MLREPLAGAVFGVALIAAIAAMLLILLGSMAPRPSAMVQTGFAASLLTKLAERLRKIPSKERQEAWLRVARRPYTEEERAAARAKLVQMLDRMEGALGEGAAIAIAMVPFLLAAILFSYFGLQRRAWQQGGGDK